MPISDRNLAPGTVLTASFKKAHYQAMVSAGEDGKLVFTLGDGRSFKSPSAAGSAVTGGSCNGWVFWSREGEAPAPSPTEATAAMKGEPKPKSPKRLIRRVPNQKGTPENQTRWFCDGCCDSFYAPSDSTPDNCPKGHSAEPLPTTVA